MVNRSLGADIYYPEGNNYIISSRQVIGGSTNTGMGFQVFESLAAGTLNVAFGLRALGASTTANNTIALGYQSGFLVAAGTNNTICDNSVFIGYETRAGASGQTNQIVIGHEAIGLGSNTAVLGNSSITTTALRGNVGIGTTAPSSKLEVAGLITATGIAANGTSSPRTYALGDSTSTRGLEFFTGGSALYYREGSAAYFALYTGGVKLASNSSIGWCATSPDGNPDTILLRDGETDHLAMRRTTNGQKFSVYGTYPGAAWERFTITAPTSGNVLLGTYKGTGGIARGLEIQTDGVSRWTISTAGHFLAAADNSYDIGASGANRPRNVYVGSSLFTGSGIGAGVYHPTFGGLAFQSSGVVTVYGGNSYTTFDKFQFGNLTSAFPALKRVGTELQVVIASTTAAINVAAADADMTFIEDRFRRKGAGDPNGSVTAPIGAVYHRTDGGAVTSFYVKESSPTPTTGWVGK
jgi:hypothetical protein